MRNGIILWRSLVEDIPVAHGSTPDSGIFASTADTAVTRQIEAILFGAYVLACEFM
jgi:hypothetical protein